MLHECSKPAHQAPNTPVQGGFTSSTWVEALGADWFAGGPIAQQYI